MHETEANDVQPHEAAALARALLGREPSPASARRMAKAANAVHAALEEIAGESLFDTEPQNLETVLTALAGEPRTSP